MTRFAHEIPPTSIAERWLAARLSDYGERVDSVLAAAKRDGIPADALRAAFERLEFRSFRDRATGVPCWTKWLEQTRADVESSAPTRETPLALTVTATRSAAPAAAPARPWPPPVAALTPAPTYTPAEIANRELQILYSDEARGRETLAAALAASAVSPADARRILAVAALERPIATVNAADVYARRTDRQP